MAEPARLYQALGGSAGCHSLSTAFYAHVEQDPLLRPLFPSTFTCAIEEFSAFLIQFLGGDPAATQRRWWLSLKESHDRFSISPTHRAAWLKAMAAALNDCIPDPQIRAEFQSFFQHSSAHVVNEGTAPKPKAITGELAGLWQEQLAVDKAATLAHPPDNPQLAARFARSPAIHAHYLSKASQNPALREYALNEIRRNPNLVHERYAQSRTLLDDAAAAGDLTLVELLLDLGAAETAGDRPLYSVGNQCSAPAGPQVVHLLVQRAKQNVNAPHGAKDCTPLHMAARRGNAKVIEALIDEGAHLEARDSQGETPLRRAVNCNKVEAAKVLLARGADPNSIGSKRLTAQQAARSPQMQQLFATRLK
jgi:hemoglobin